MNMNVIKKLWKNKLTRIYILAGGIVLLLIIGILIVSFATRSTGVNETSIVNAAKKYLKENDKLLPQDDYDSRTITLSTLIASDYFKSDDEGASCSSYVTVVKIEDEYFYTPYIKCNEDDDTTLLADVLLSNVVEVDDGLYSNDNEYIYRGEDPSNYIVLNNILWRIVKLDSSNNIELIYYDYKYDSVRWDDRYNSTVERQFGINEYSLSRIKDYLNSYTETLLNDDSEMFPAILKSKLLKHDQCIGSLNLEANIVDDCSEVETDQIVGTITAMEYINASLDTSCSVTNTINCQNYNYLNRSSWTISAYAEDNLNVYYIDEDEGLLYDKAYNKNVVYPTILLRSNIIYVSGSGTETDPYIIK